MTAEHPGGDVAKTACPLQCWLRRGNATDALSNGRTPARDHVDWAGLPINLDLAFSQQQCDKVYRQHLMRKRGAELWRWSQDGAQPCACDIAAEHAHDHGNAEKLGITN